MASSLAFWESTSIGHYYNGEYAGIQ
jgi:hypothetical protein